MKRVSVVLIILSVFLTIPFSSKGQSIHRSACNGNVKRVDSLLKANDINVLDKNGRTILLYATGCRREKVFDLLMTPPLKTWFIHPLENLGPSSCMVTNFAMKYTFHCSALLSGGSSRMQGTP